MSPVNYGTAFYLFIFFKARSLYVAQAGLKFPILLPLVLPPPPPLELGSQMGTTKPDSINFCTH